jgi:hypothetical protein
LVREPEGRDLVSLGADSSSDFAQGGHGEFDDLVGIVFHLAGGGEVLGEFAVVLRHHRELVIKGHRSHAGGAGVEGEDEFHRVRLVRRGAREWGCDWGRENCEKEFKEVVDTV